MPETIAAVVIVLVALGVAKVLEEIPRRQDERTDREERQARRGLARLMDR